MDDAAAAPAAGRPDRPAAAQAAPTRLLALAFAIAVLVIGGAIAFSVSQPWLGLNLRFDAKAGGAVVASSAGPGAAIPAGAVITTVTAGGDRIVLERTDLTGQVDGSFGPFADYQRFMDRQGRLADMMREPAVTFTDTAGRDWTVQPQQSGRPIASLGPDFWIGMVVGAVAWLIAAAIFAFRPRETAARYVLLSGVASLLFIPIGPIYTARELGLPETAFYLINGANFLGGSLYAAATFALMLYYPNRLVPRWVGWAVIGVFLVWYVAQAIGLFPDLTFARRFLVLCALFGAFGLSAIHWRLSRRDPVARAALGWFVLSWVLVVAVFGLLILAPQMFGVDTEAAEPYAFLMFLLTYGGLAVGIMRYRLFELGAWWGRIMAWTLALALLAALDMLFLVGLRLSAEVSLSIALLICGLVWLPVRGWIAERMLQRRRTDDRDVFEGLVQIGLSAQPQDQLAHWVEVLKRRFDPLRLDVAEAHELPGLGADGLALVTPALAGLPALRLEYAHGGRALFSPADEQQARSLADMLGFVFQSREAYERGVAVERKRIAGDIHDNLGATLLSALHSRDGERKDRYIRETLADLRSIVTEPTGPDAGLADTLARSRKEMAERLQARGVALVWPLDAAPPPGVDSKTAQSLRAIVRELTNNILKHAQAREVRVSLAADRDALVLTVEDDGRGFDPAAVTPGAGLGGLADRARSHGGTLTWSPGEGGKGARCTIRLPRTA
ncbi:sensor histidine kinase [Phenylobacterium sp.]|uniref:sensor histidine kinase n=1 Tax=Phenylobacterium sp. TaxID=1871053 RepID=UPI002ED7C192